MNATWPAREQLNERAFNAAWEEGQAMSMEQAIAYGLDPVEGQ